MERLSMKNVGRGDDVVSLSGSEVLWTMSKFALPSGLI